MQDSPAIPLQTAVEPDSTPSRDNFTILHIHGISLERGDTLQRREDEAYEIQWEYAIVTSLFLLCFLVLYYTRKQHTTPSSTYATRDSRTISQLKLIDYEGGKTKVNPEPTIEESAWSQVVTYGETVHLGAFEEPTAPKSVVVYETDEEDVDESAIDDDWEDSDESESESKSASASIDDKALFHRVNTPPNLTTRRSLITTMLHQNDGAAFALRSTPALPVSSNGPSLAASPDSDNGSFLMMKKTNLKPITEVPRSGSAPQPIIQTTTNGHHPQPALSPRTTRRNMLATELTVSLRQHLLWERQQKSQTANAVLKRRHTAHDVANLKQYPDKVHMGNDDRDEMHASWNQYFGEGLNEYHSKGW